MRKNLRRANCAYKSQCIIGQVKKRDSYFQRSFARSFVYLVALTLEAFSLVYTVIRNP